jgi:hypothetical protein
VFDVHAGLRRVPHSSRASLLLALGLALLAAGCAAVQARQARTEALTRALDRSSCGVSLDEAWNEALRLLDERGYQLAGKDAEVVGKHTLGYLGFLSKARETRPDGHGGQVADTGFLNGQRYELLGNAGAPGCHVTLLAVKEDTSQRGRDSGDAPQRDPEAELALLRRLAPDEAARVEAQSAPAPLDTDGKAKVEAQP